MIKPAALFSTLILASFIAACGASPAPQSATPGVPPAGTSEPTASNDAPAAPTAWSDSMPLGDQVAFMSATINPRLGKVFKEHDASRYADFGCKTCHGPNKQAPTDFLPKLIMRDGKITSFVDKPEVSQWMATKVIPEMAAALGEPPFDPATQKGFGCGGCHAIEKK